ncbi:transporter [Chitinophaga sp. S165]|uniref:transporter n=1 Tax=Chitinophaga sp. S165 TaxID=2135462 RepID=UPI000D9A1F4D|nr:transporter [Chitinophaga sp. S165]PWV48333.1 outer membrane putative beta-barrel porin/alpha-amylase [Chitinophaga sp. S165]
MKKISPRMVVAAMLLFAMMLPRSLSAQTDIDALMMAKNAFCVGPMYSYSSWKNYWEGTLKRDNENLGTVSTKMAAVMGNYGISKRLNVLFSVPYVKTKASAGTLQGMDGLQDLSLFLKWRPLQKEMGKGKLSVFGIAGVSFPLTDYTPDYLPLSIGLRSKTALGRLMVDYKLDMGLFATASATYLLRDNIDIDRESYYTTEMHNTHEVKMPDAANYNFRAGFRNRRWIAEAVVNIWNTLGGFDITRNNMPFPSNNMDATMVGANFKYVIPPLPQLQLVAGGNTTVAGRNVGQARTVYGSIFYILDFSRKSKSPNPTSNAK